MSELRKYKQFPSLYKRKSGFQPLNTLLSSPNDRQETRPITITKPLKELSTHSNSPSDFLGPLAIPVAVPKTPTPTYTTNDTSPASEPKRSNGRTSPLRFYSSHTFKKIKQSDQILTSFANSITISATDLTSTPTLSFPVASIMFNDIPFQEEDLFVKISKNQRFLFFSRGEMLINKLIVDRVKHLETIKFAADKKSLLIELKHHRGYIYATYTADDSELIKFFDLQKQWSVKPKPRYPTDKLEEVMKLLRSENKEHLKLPATYIAPRIRATRANTSSGEAEPLTAITNTDGSITMVEKEKEAEEIVIEKPADFDPELKYSFRNNKEFIISYSDFKTLYNNDWINDSLIDFFIMYEIEKAVYDKKTFKENEIHAFNSFFFTKLMSKSDTFDTVDYYGNIKRWLTKLDLMSFPYIIMPICENLHWYGCVIKGLPDLLKPAAPPQDRDYESDGAKSKSPDSGSRSAEASPSKGPSSGFSRKFSNVAEIYIFDSLSQRHANIGDPIKSFIVDYCYDKHGITVTKDRIRVHTARVPKQKNFNDCGIHVIYNVRKFLSLPAECEKIWRSYSKTTARMFFVATERIGLRRELIDKLLELHKRQTELQEEYKKLNPVSKTKLEHSDDEIEVIEYKLKEKKLEPSSEEPHPSNTTQSKPEASQNEPETPPNKPTDVDIAPSPIQRLKQTVEKGMELLQIPTSSKALKNKSLREMFYNQLLSPSIISILNDVFPDKLQKFNTEQSSLVIDLKKALEANSDEKIRKRKISHFCEVFSALGRSGSTPMKERPMNESFIVQPDRNDSDELNRSVDNLHISNPPVVKKYTGSGLSKQQMDREPAPPREARFTDSEQSKSESMEMDEAKLENNIVTKNGFNLQDALQADLEAQIEAHSKANPSNSILEVPDSQSADDEFLPMPTDLRPKFPNDSREAVGSQDEVKLKPRVRGDSEVEFVDEKRVKRKAAESHVPYSEQAETGNSEQSEETDFDGASTKLSPEGFQSESANESHSRILRSAERLSQADDVQEIEVFDVDKELPEEEPAGQRATSVLEHDEIEELPSPAFAEGFLSPSFTQSPRFNSSFEFGSDDGASPLTQATKRKQQEKHANDRKNRISTIQKKLVEMAELLSEDSAKSFPSLVEYELNRISLPKYGKRREQVVSPKEQRLSHVSPNEQRLSPKHLKHDSTKEQRVSHTSPKGHKLHNSPREHKLHVAKELTTKRVPDIVQMSRDLDDDVFEVVFSDDEQPRRSRSEEPSYKEHGLHKRSRSKRRRLNGTPH